MSGKIRPVKKGKNQEDPSSKKRFENVAKVKKASQEAVRLTQQSRDIFIPQEQAVQSITYSQDPKIKGLLKRQATKTSYP